jgi:hypothetical protein
VASLYHPPTMSFIGYTTWDYDPTNDTFLPDTMVRIEDPVETPVTRLSNGNYVYDGFETTVFQTLLHELGHALGLAHSPNDPTSIMYPTTGSVNPVPDAQDIAGIQAIYGASKLARISHMLDRISIYVSGAVTIAN